MQTKTIVQSLAWLACWCLLPSCLGDAKPDPITPAKYMDGKKTFCYDDYDLDKSLPAIGQNTTYKWHDYACPVWLKVVPTTDNSTWKTHTAIPFTLEASTQFGPNEYNLKRLEATTKDKNNRVVQTDFAVVYGCEDIASCDLRNGRTYIAPLDEGSGNFSDGKAQFAQNVTFTTPGEKLVIGYLELPRSAASHDQVLHFITYLSITVQQGDSPSSSSSSTSSPKPSSGIGPAGVKENKTENSGSSHSTLFVILGIVIGILVIAVIALVIVKRRNAKEEDNKTVDLMPPSEYEYDGSGASTIPAPSGPPPYASVVSAANYAPAASNGGYPPNNSSMSNGGYAPNNSNRGYGPNNSSLMFAPMGVSTTTAPRAMADDMTFHIPEPRGSVESEESLGTGQTLDFVGMEPSPMAVPPPHSQQYEVLDGSAYYQRHPSDEVSTLDDETIRMPSRRTDLHSQPSYGTDDDDAGYTMRTIQLPSQI